MSQTWDDDTLAGDIRKTEIMAHFEEIQAAKGMKVRWLPSIRGTSWIPYDLEPDEAKAQRLIWRDWLLGLLLGLITIVSIGGALFVLGLLLEALREWK